MYYIIYAYEFMNTLYIILPPSLHPIKTAFTNFMHPICVYLSWSCI